MDSEKKKRKNRRNDLAAWRPGDLEAAVWARVKPWLAAVGPRLGPGWATVGPGLGPGWAPPWVYIGVLELGLTASGRSVGWGGVWFELCVASQVWLGLGWVRTHSG